MRVLVVASVTLYSSDVPILLEKALRKLGCETELFAVNEDLPLLERVFYRDPLKFNYRLFNRRFLRKAMSWQPDLIFIYGSNWGIYPETLRRLKDRLGCSVAIWEGNFYLWRWFQSESIALYDHFFCLDSHLIPLLKASTALKSIHFLGGCCDPDEHRSINLSPDEKVRYDTDICFIGTPHANRLQLFENLKSYQLTLWGPGWEKSPALKSFAQTEPVYGLKKTRIYNGARISVNLQSTKFQVNGLSVRIFEVAACGGFSITEAKPDLPLFFNPQDEIETFTDAADLKRKVEYYLGHPKERQEMANRAKRRVLAEHTYTHRAQTILDVVAGG